MGNRAGALLFGACASAVGLACGPKPTSEAAGHGVLVIAIDALRADHLSCAGYDRPTTPVLDRLAEQGVLFESTWSPSPDMVPAHVGLLTGCDPELARRPSDKRDGFDPDVQTWLIPEDVPDVAGQFLAAGYETAAFIDHPSISPAYGFAQGFQSFFAFGEDLDEQGTPLGFEAVAGRFAHWLNERDSTHDWFAYLQVHDLERMWERPSSDPRWDTLFEPRDELALVPPVAVREHEFFALPRSRWTGGSTSLGEYEARYDGALRQLDTKLGRVLQRMRVSGVLKHTTVVVVGTHGLSFGESGRYLTSGTLAASDLRVPWIFRPSPTFEGTLRAQRSSALASLLDVGPTLLDLSGIQPASGMQGISQRAVLEGDNASARELAFAAGGLAAARAAIDASFCFEERAPGQRWAEGAWASWHGAEQEPTSAGQTFLFDHRPKLVPGRLTLPVENAEAQTRLSMAARDWYVWIERARDALHAPTSMRAQLDPELRRELERRGLFRVSR